MGRVRVRAQNNYYYVAFQSVERNVCALTPEMQKTLSILRIPVKSATCPLQIGHPAKRSVLLENIYNIYI